MSASDDFSDSEVDVIGAEAQYKDFGSSTGSSFDDPAATPVAARPSALGAASARASLGAHHAVLPALQRLGGIGGDLARQTRELGAMQLMYERQLSRLRARAREEAHEARARERQLRKLASQRTEQLDILKADLSTVVRRLEESEEHGHALHAALQEHRLEVSRLRELLADRERRLATAESAARSTAVQLSTAQAELHSALESGSAAQSGADEARAERDDALAELSRLREAHRAQREESEEIRAAVAGEGEQFRRAAAQLAGLSRLGLSVSDTAATDLRLALLRWHRQASKRERALSAWARLTAGLTDGGREARLRARSERWARYMRRWMSGRPAASLTGEHALSVLLAHWRLLAQGRQLSAHCQALEAQRQNLTVAHTGAWWAAAGDTGE